MIHATFKTPVRVVLAPGGRTLRVIALSATDLEEDENPEFIKLKVVEIFLHHDDDWREGQLPHAWCGSITVQLANVLSIATPSAVE